MFRLLTHHRCWSRRSHPGGAFENARSQNFDHRSKRACWR
jgi:hypothetical protein